MTIHFNRHRPFGSGLSPVFLGALLSGLAGPTASFAMDETAEKARPSVLEEIIVVGARASLRLESTEGQLDVEEVMAPQAADLASLIPGGAAIDNGALSGQVQYRGLMGARVPVAINGQTFGSGGPNLMDPPLHYAPLPLLASLEYARGVGPVSKGPGLGGTMNASLKSVPFGLGEAFQPTGDLTVLGHSNGRLVGLGGVGGVANDRLRFGLLGAYEEGEDQTYSGGTIANTFFERSVWGVETGVASAGGDHQGSLSYRRYDTGPSGNPPFSMDIEFVDGDFLQGGYEGSLAGWALTFDVHWSNIEHGMTNYLSRPAPMAMMQRRTLAESESYGTRLAASHDLGAGILTLGADGAVERHGMRITNPNDPNFFLDAIADAEAERVGVFLEWLLETDQGGLQFGVRGDLHSASSEDPVLGSSVPAMPGMLAMNFAMQDLDWSDETFDSVLKGWFNLNERVTLRGTVALKSRVPSYLERYAWLPTPASGGLADGNTYVGDLALEPEEALIAEVGIDLMTETLRFRPSLFYHSIDNYIQGVPYDDTIGVSDTPVEMVSAMNGDPTPLRFANVDAELYGADFDISWRFADHMQFDGLFSYVKGERRDSDDALYRIAPLTVRAGVTWLDDLWRATIEVVTVAEQNEVSATNSETPTKGHTLINLYGSAFLGERTTLDLGVTNLFNVAYEDHLAGRNRISGSDVALGARLPGPGLDVFARVSYRF